MTLVSYDPEQTLRDARARYFQVNQFGDNGGYDDAWVDFKLGPLPFPFPNTPARVRAVRYHDLHHVLTGYDTNTIGEFEISAWEIAAGCKSYLAAWQLNLGGMFAGMFISPRRIWSAFLRGRSSHTLYDRSLDALLDGSVRAARGETGLDAKARAPTLADALAFGLALLAGLMTAAITLPLVLLCLPLGLAAAAWRRSTAKRAAYRQTRIGGS
jgi:hypothetical protein